MGSPSAFVSYSWDDDDHKKWVRDLAAQLRGDGVEVILDQWHTVPGDQLPEFMETAVRENDYVLIVCTPRYKERSDKRVGGVGYEGDVITGEVVTTRNQRKFIPILRRGTWQEAAPSWSVGKSYVNLSGSPYSEDNYQDLLTTLLGTRPGPPPVRQPLAGGSPESPWQGTGQSSGLLARRLTELCLDDEGREDFGESKVTAGVARLDSRYVILAAIPLDTVSCSRTNVLMAARTMLDLGHWYTPNPDDPPPRYWPRTIFEVPQRRRSHQNALFWEDLDYRSGSSAAFRLVVTDRAEVFFVSSKADGFVNKLRDETGVFLLGRILAGCWQLSGLVAQLYSDIGHSGDTHLCIAMVGTEGTHLGGFAEGYPEPFEEHYWFWVTSAATDWRCHAPNLNFCHSVDVLGMEPKKQPQFVNDFADDISLAYNHDSPRCFDKKTGLIPVRYFRNR